MRICLYALIGLGCFSLFTSDLVAAPNAGSVTPMRLRCEYRVDPLGVDSPNPRLDWILQPTNPAARGLAQSAYEVLVASTSDLLAGDEGDLWDSGKVGSDQMNQVAYAGKSLSSNQAVWWKVKVWDQNGLASAWSPVAQWTMGVLRDADWSGAKWITAFEVGPPSNLKGPKPSDETLLLRREFTVRPDLRRALVQVCGLGQYEMTLNGAKVGDARLSPGWTFYNKTCLYDTYDVTAALRTGTNAAGLFLGNGFFNVHGGRYTKLTGSFGPVQVIALIHLDYEDGSVDNIVTDDTWRIHSGPITFSSIYGGEDYDARLIQDGWDKPGFNDSGWDLPAITNGPGGVLKGISVAGPPIRCFDVLNPVGSKSLGPGVTVYDLGQNASLMLRLKVSGAVGSSVKITPSELVKANGDIDDTMCKGKSFWTYTLSGTGDEDYLSHFYYRGGRYLKVELRPAAGDTNLPTVESIEGDAIRADAPAVGRFSCSNELCNKIYDLIRWAQMNNMVSVMTDCPTREKLGWLEEDHLNGAALRYNFDLSTLFTKMVGDMADSQRASGLVPSTCPDYPRWADDNKYVTPPEWGSACILVPWQQYQFNGDLDLLRRHYGMMTAYVGYLESRAVGNVVNFGLGDWYDNLGSGPATLTPVALTGTAFYYEDVRTLAKVASLLGNADDAVKYNQQADEILTSFNEQFFSVSTNNYATGSQASNAVPLALNMVNSSQHAAVLGSLVNDLRARQSTVGEVCLEFLLKALAEGGCSDLLYSTFASDKAGYGLQVKLGKTSLTEGWNGGGSQDHFMFGQLNEWLFGHLAGIQSDPDVPGFMKIIIQPAVVGDLTEVKASYDSIRGKITSEWKRNGSSVTLHVIIPPNTTATIYVPATSPDLVTEGGVSATQAYGIRFVKMEQGAAIYQLGSGNYTFRSRMP